MRHQVERPASTPPVMMYNAAAQRKTADRDGRKAGCRAPAFVGCSDKTRAPSWGLLNEFHKVVRDLGGDPEMLLAEARIDERSSLDWPASARSLLVIAQVLEYAAMATGCADFGLRLAEAQSRPLIANPLNRLLWNAPTVGDTMRCCIDHQSAFSPGILINLDHDEERALHFMRYEILGGSSLFPQLTEQIALLTHNSVVAVTG